MADYIIKLSNIGSNISLLEEKVEFSIISKNEITSIVVYTIIDIVHNKPKQDCTVEKIELIDSSNSIYTYKVLIDLNLIKISETNTDLLLNIATLNIKSVFKNSEDDVNSVLILQIVKEKNIFYKNIIIS